MTHSVSHTLFIELNGRDTTLATVKKDGTVVNLLFFPSVNREKMQDILEKTPDIFSNTHLLIRKKDFITVPEDFYQNTMEDLYRLSYDIKAGEKLYMDRSDHQVGIVYASDIGLLEVVTKKFPRVRINNEVTVILSKLYKEVSFKLPGIFVSINDGHLIIIAVNDGKLMLCNSYRAKSNHDIFYFVMLTIEQLQMLPAEAKLVILGEPSNFSELNELFKNYIREINTWKEEYKFTGEFKNNSLLLNSFPLQTMLCE